MNFRQSFLQTAFVMIGLSSLLCFVQFTSAQEQKTSEASPAETAVEVDQQKLKSIDERMNELIEADKFNGGNGLVFAGGKEVYYSNWGDADRKAKKPVKRDTIFRIYSMSKPITSVAVMQLVEQGKIKLDEPVATYLPEFADLKVLEKDQDDDGKFVEVEPKRTMTVRDLLRHTSGLTYGFFGNTEVDKRYRRAGILGEKKIEQTVENLGKLPLLYHPATQFQYSVSSDVLGRVVEVASEERFDRYLQKHIFDPLKMSDTFFIVPETKRDRFAQLYAPSGEGLKPASPLRSFKYVNDKNLMFSGGGGLCSTIDDYLRFSRMLLNQGELDGARILKSESVEEMFKNQLAEVEKSSRWFKFGLGFSISPNGDRGWGGAAGTKFWVNPKTNTIIIFMMQINPGTPKIGEQFRELVYGAIRTPRKK